MPPKKAKGKAPIVAVAEAPLVNMFEDEDKASPANGGCIPEAIANILGGVTTEFASEALDRLTEEWKSDVGKSSKQGLRGDQKSEEFLGVPGATWHIQVLCLFFVAYRMPHLTTTQRD